MPSLEPGVPMTTILLLFTLGAVLLALDLFVPGIIMSVFAVMVILAGTWRAFADYGLPGGFSAFGAGTLLVGVVLYIEYGLLPKTALGRRFFLHAAVDGTSQQPASDNLALVGRECVAVTPLVPTGQVEIDGKRREALSLDGHVERGARLRITGAQNFSLTVTVIKSS